LHELNCISTALRAALRRTVKMALTVPHRLLNRCRSKPGGLLIIDNVPMPFAHRRLVALDPGWTD